MSSGVRVGSGPRETRNSTGPSAVPRRSRSSRARAEGASVGPGGRRTSTDDTSSRRSSRSISKPAKRRTFHAPGASGGGRGSRGRRAVAGGGAGRGGGGGPAPSARGGGGAGAGRPGRGPSGLDVGARPRKAVPSN